MTFTNVQHTICRLESLANHKNREIDASTTRVMIVSPGAIRRHSGKLLYDCCSAKVFRSYHAGSTVEAEVLFGPLCNGLVQGGFFHTSICISVAKERVGDSEWRAETT
jgi:hypothetical protein